jgi:Protein of unknown function (DUF2510)/Glucodextranase, domain B
MAGSGGSKRSDAPGPVRPLPSWVPAGWYPDPLGQGAARYWDGKRWSLEYRDAPPPQPIPAGPSEVAAAPSPSAPGSTPQASAGQPGPEPNAKPSVSDRWKEIPKGARIVIGVVALIIIIAIASSGSGSKKTSSSAANTSSATPATPTTPALTPVSLKLATGNYAVTSTRTILRGTVTPGAAVTVNEHPARVQGNRWSDVVGLALGDNTITVVASMAGHESTTETITITRNESQAEREAKQRAREEAQRRHEAEEQAKKQHYLESAETIPYAQLNKNPEEYVGKTVKYHGQIFQIQEQGGEGGLMLLSVTEVTEGFWDDNIWVNYDFHVKAAAKALVTVYGEVTGQKSYKTQIGGETYVPEIKAKYIVE